MSTLKPKRPPGRPPYLVQTGCLLTARPRFLKFSYSFSQILRQALAKTAGP